MTFDELNESDLAALASGEFGGTATLTAKGGGPPSGSIDLSVGDEASREEEAEQGQEKVKTVQALMSRAEAVAILGRDVGEEDTVTMLGRTWAVTTVEMDGTSVKVELMQVVPVSVVKGERVRRG